ncbi:hypothetical protein TR51_22265 [Kitasatospora griseola]|uniref:Uncharacterized protein n=1 Tax=Kitasatospora griseola TaxID=2064 RepID=A0A0D0PTH8_KITGR|nr:hypothetical protein [Kitasatospora griseola]KIQ61948.1 hypothetical protein TR51_22265 [Kitasatospora griseola]
MAVGLLVELLLSAEALALRLGRELLPAERLLRTAEARLTALRGRRSAELLLAVGLLVELLLSAEALALRLLGRELLPAERLLTAVRGLRAGRGGGRLLGRRGCGAAGGCWAVGARGPASGRGAGSPDRWPRRRAALRAAAAEGRRVKQARRAGRVRPGRRG